MVSLRYHLVSLGAALMALAAGVVLGAGPLSTTVNQALAAQKPSTASDAAALTTLRNQQAYDTKYAVATATTLVRGQLAQRHVVLIVAPGVPASLVAGVTSSLGQAGATVTGPVRLSAAWLDPAEQAVLAGITSQLAPATPPAGATQADEAAAALAASVVSTRTSARPADTATALLAGLVQGGFVTVTGQPAQAATMAVLLVPATGTAQGGLLPLARALSTTGAAAVIVGPRGSATSSGAIGAMRAAPGTGTGGALLGGAPAAGTVSSVDNVDLASGQVAMVLALKQQIGPGGGHGQYGQGRGADAPLPPVH